MRKVRRTIWALFSVYYAHMMEYRAELIFWVLSGLLPFILMGIWMEASKAGNFSLDPLEFSRYFLAVFLARQFNVVWVIWDFEREVLEGTLSSRLLQPIDPVWRGFAGHFAERFVRLPFVGLIVLLFFALYPDAFWLPGVGNILLFLMAVFLAFALRFLMQYTYAMFAFWTERAVAIEQFWFLFYLFLSGMIAPLELYPPLIREIILWTPFPYLIYFPANILVGLPVNWGKALLVMVIWGFIFWRWNRWLWRQGLKQYSGMGA